MSTETIFEGATTPVEPVVPPSAPVVPTELAEIVGEGKKYKSVEDALKSVPHAQSHIQRLEDEAKQLRDELAKRQTAEELLNELKATGYQAGTVNQQPTSGPVDVEAIVASVLNKKEAQTKAQANVATVVSSFEQAFGDKTKAQEMYLKVAEESGLTVQDLNRLAATSPGAVLQLAGLKKKENSSVGKVQGTVNTSFVPNTNGQELSAKVKQGASTRDLVNAWRIAGEKVKQKYGN